MAGGELDHGGGVTDAFLIARGVGAVAEGAAGRWVDGAGDIASGEVALRAVGGVGDGDGAEEGAGVGVERASGDGFGGPDFHDAAEVHDGDAGGDVADDGEVVGDEEVADAGFALEVHEEVEDLALDGDVECGDWFVADDEFWVEGEGAGDADALALAAAEFEGEAVCGGGGEADLGEEGGDAEAAIGGGADFVDVERFADDVADGHARVEGFCGVLEDHLEVAGEGAGAEAGDVAGVEEDGASGGGIEAGDGFAEGGFAAAAFADEAEGFAGMDLEGDPVDGAAGTDGAAEDSAPDWEVDTQVGDGEERHGEGNVRQRGGSVKV